MTVSVCVRVCFNYAILCSIEDSDTNLYVTERGRHDLRRVKITFR